MGCGASAQVAPAAAPAARRAGSVASRQHPRGEAAALVDAAVAAHSKGSDSGLSSTDGSTGLLGLAGAAKRSLAGVAEARRFVELKAASEVQQELNMCQTTAVAHALTLLGHPTSVDDIITLVRIPIESAVGDGMTLAETHELALRYIEKAGLPVHVGCHHFDALAGATAAAFRTACVADMVAGASECLALNFHSGMAHGWSAGGGGHFSLLMGAVPTEHRQDKTSGGALDLMMADVHPLKYGAFWSCPLEQMFAAMADRDSCGRSRGMLRFVAVPRAGGVLHKVRSVGLEAVMERGSSALAKTCVNWAGDVVAGHSSFMLRRFVPPEWDSHIGTNNMGGMCALSLGINVVQGWMADGISLASCMRLSRQSHVEHLRTFCTSEGVASAASRLASNRDMINSKLALGVRHIPFGATVASFREALAAARVDLTTTVLILPFDVNVARGGTHVVLGNTEAAKMSHGAKAWAAVASFNLKATDDDQSGVVLCSATGVIRDGRLWSTSVARLHAATMCGQVRDGAGVAIDWEVKNNQARMDELFELLDADRDGHITAEELHASMASIGLDPSVEEAEELVKTFNVDDNKETLTRDEVFGMFKKALGYYPGQSQAGPRRQKLLRKYMEDNGCVQNELGFSTCHLAVETADIRANVAFYNGVLGWPLYKTVDRAHAGQGEDTYGSSWASYGAFASFIVFHKEETPIGRAGHGPWADSVDCPEALMPPVRSATAGGKQKDSLAGGGLSDTIALDHIPYPCFGVVLEPSFFAKQMERIAAKSPELRWLEVAGADRVLGGGVAERAVCFRDPDGWPFILFVSPLVGDDYRARHPAVPFVFCCEFRLSPSVEEDKKVIRRPITAAMASELKKDQLRVTKEYYSDTLGATLLAEDAVCDPSGDRRLLQYEWCGHFLCLRSNPTNVPPALRDNKGIDSSHNMGANKGVVPMPHFGPNAPYSTFDLIRGRVDAAMTEHGIPVEDLWCLTRTGRAPPFNHLDAHSMLFPTDPDSCLSQFLTDPSGNAFEVKWYLDFGEMFHHSGEVGVTGLQVDNSMAPDHFPPKVQALMAQRVRRGDSIGKDAMLSPRSHPIDKQQPHITGFH